MELEQKYNKNAGKIKVIIYDENGEPVLGELDGKKYLIDNNVVTPMPWLDRLNFIEVENLVKGVAEVKVSDGKSSYNALFNASEIGLYKDNIQFLPCSNMDETQILQQTTLRINSFVGLARHIYDYPGELYMLAPAIAIIDEEAAKFLLAIACYSKMNVAKQAKKLIDSKGSLDVGDGRLVKGDVERIYADQMKGVSDFYTDIIKQIKQALILKNEGYYYTDLMYTLEHSSYMAEFPTPEKASSLVLLAIINLPALNSIFEHLGFYDKKLDDMRLNLKNNTKEELAKKDAGLDDLIVSIKQALIILKEQKNLLQEYKEGVDYLSDRYDCLANYLKTFLDSLSAELTASKTNSISLMKKAIDVQNEIKELQGVLS